MNHTPKSSRNSWWDRICERTYRATTPRLVREMEQEAPRDYSELLKDLKAPLEPAFEREVARHLDRGGYRAFVPADTLMPAMLQRFGLDESSVAGHSSYPSLRGNCNACPVAGYCWHAMRRDADADECRAFCPNAAAFDRQAAKI
ncbi:hypothetical protein [Halomonas sp. BC04]|uniref:hypothetical protein n=1 Tax=Halomonas sp. BC04 TaxID=1403540 RepID=UPI0003ED6722|nr:hypothetical protein [Halomonas sp. BC04]EWH00491.1 hypothetical protein Q427_19140 [Halomonas sp. BC04]